VGAGLLILRARRHYPTDVVSASEYESRSAGEREAEHAARPRVHRDRVGIDATKP